MTAVERPETETVRPVLPVLLGLKELTQLCTGVTDNTVYRWRTRKNLPEPLVVVSGTPVWDEETLLVWIQARKLDIDRRALARIRKAQSH